MNWALVRRIAAGAALLAVIGALTPAFGLRFSAAEAVRALSPIAIEMSERGLAIRI